MPLQIGIDSGHAGTRRIAVEQRWGSMSVVPAGGRPAQVILSASAARLTFRALSFPFSDRRRLEVMVAQELEHSLGFPPGEAAWDFVARPPAADGDNVYVVACKQSDLGAVMSAVSDETPTVVDAEPYAYQRVLALAGVADALVADFGATHTTFCRISGGHIDYIRVLLRGGNDLDSGIARRQGGTPSSARILKEDKGIALAEVREFFDRVVSDALLPAEPPTVPIYLTGGGARTRGLTDWLSNKLARPVLLMPVPEGVDPSRDVVALGMALWGAKNAEGVNLYRPLETRSYARPIAILLILMVAFITADLGIRQYVLQRQLQKVEDAVRLVCRNAAGVQSLGELQSIVEARKPKSSGLDLEELVRQVAGAVKEAQKKEAEGELKVTHVTFNGTQVKMEGSAKAFPPIDALKSAMASRFPSVDVSTVNSPGGVTFTLVAALK